MRSRLAARISILIAKRNVVCKHGLGKKNEVSNYALGVVKFISGGGGALDLNPLLCTSSEA